MILSEKFFRSAKTKLNFLVYLDMGENINELINTGKLAILQHLSLLISLYGLFYKIVEYECIYLKNFI